MSISSRTPTQIKVSELQVHFERGKRRPWSSPTVVRAVDGVSLKVRRGEILGVVGESGSGKTTLGRAMLGLAPITAGRVHYTDRELDSIPPRELRRRAQMVFQEPHASLSPRWRVGRLLTEPYRIHRIPPDDQRDVTDLLDMVQLGPEQATKFPHQLSGGQARRVGIARALALQPELVVADEPTAGLDVSAGADVLNLLTGLRDTLDLTFLLITHDLNVVGHVADRIAVMYLGRLAEVGPVERVIDRPAHPYTRALLASVPDADQVGGETPDPVPAGEIPSPVHPPPGCRFHPRCPYADSTCSIEMPELEPVADGQEVSCHHWRTIENSRLPQP